MLVPRWLPGKRIKRPCVVHVILLGGPIAACLLDFHHRHIPQVSLIARTCDTSLYSTSSMRNGWENRDRNLYDVPC